MKQQKRCVRVFLAVNEAIRMAVVANSMTAEVANSFHLILHPENRHQAHMMKTMMKAANGEKFHMNNHLKEDSK
jgi:hypothetical protein